MRGSMVLAFWRFTVQLDNMKLDCIGIEYTETKYRKGRAGRLLIGGLHILTFVGLGCPVERS